MQTARPGDRRAKPLAESSLYNSVRCPALAADVPPGRIRKTRMTHGLGSFSSDAPLSARAPRGCCALELLKRGRQHIFCAPFEADSTGHVTTTDVYDAYLDRTANISVLPAY